MLLDFQSLSISRVKELLSSADDKGQQEIIHLLEDDGRTGIRKLVSSLKSGQQKAKQSEKEFKRLCSFELKLRSRGFIEIAGADEAGRGAFAGPLVAAAVVLPPHFYLPGLKESKQLTPRARDEYYEIITDRALDWQIEVISSTIIDQKGLHKANLYALEKAVLGLSATPDFVLSDGFGLPNLKLPKTSLIRGDKLSISIAAASVLAKVRRDRIMISYSDQFPQYGFEKHKGYGTKEHAQALKRYGPSTIHRLTFKPVQECVQLRLKGH